MSKGTENFVSLVQKLGEILGSKNVSHSSPKIVMFNFPKFLHTSLELNYLKTENLIKFHSIEVGQI